MPARARSFVRHLGGAVLVSVVSAQLLSGQTASDSWDITVPRGRPHTISFTTDEGTWMSLDVSPDGRTIAFDMVGEIWLLPITGGEARPLTTASGMALNYHPAFSPDGSQIAFISDRSGQDNVWIINADGSAPRQVSDQRENRMALPVWCQRSAAGAATAATLRTLRNTLCRSSASATTTSARPLRRRSSPRNTRSSSPRRRCASG